jgi:hypothetical protein
VKFIEIEMEKVIAGEIWVSSEAYKNLVTMCDEFGSRFAATDGERKAMDFITKKFKMY